MSTEQNTDHAALQRALARLDFGPAAVAALDAALARTQGQLRATVLAQVSAFSESGNPDVLPELDRHCGEQLHEILRLVSGGEIGGFDFVTTQAQRKAAQRFPLAATLAAYRCGQMVLAQWLRAAANMTDAAEAISDFVTHYTNTVSAIATADYVDHIRALAEAEGDRRSELFNILLNGHDESDSRVARLLKRAGYLEQRQAYCVAAVQPINTAEMESPARAERIATALSDALAQASIRTLIGTRNSAVVAVMSARRRQSGWTAPQANLAERIHPLLLVLGLAVRVGLSADHPSTSYLPKALHEATIALDFAGVENRVVAFSQLPIRGLLVHRGTDYIQSAPPSWIAGLMILDAKADGALIETLRAIADADMNMQKAARLLGKHPNTVYDRVERIRETTGLDGQRYHDLTELLLGADCAGAPLPQRKRGLAMPAD